MQTLQTTVGEHETMNEFLEEQMQDLNIEIDNINEQLQFQQAQQDAIHVPPDVMDMDEEEEPKEIEGYSDVDFEEADPQPAVVGSSLPSGQ